MPKISLEYEELSAEELAAKTGQELEVIVQQIDSLYGQLKVYGRRVAAALDKTILSQNAKARLAKLSPAEVAALKAALRVPGVESGEAVGQP